jgi:hypothetical protein
MFAEKRWHISTKQLVVMTAILLFSGALGTPVRAQHEKPLTKTQAMALLTTAETPADHERLAQYFNLKATKLEAEATEHKDLSNAYHKGKAPNMQNAGWCDDAAEAETKAAKENRSIGESHHKMAEGLRGSTPH